MLSKILEKKLYNNRIMILCNVLDNSENFIGKPVKLYPIDCKYQPIESIVTDVIKDTTHLNNIFNTNQYEKSEYDILIAFVLRGLTFECIENYNIITTDNIYNIESPILKRKNIFFDYQIEHTDKITDLKFDKNASILISSSKDKTVRFWDLYTYQSGFRFY